MTLAPSVEVLFQLLRVALHPERREEVAWTAVPDWEAVYRLATAQGVAAIAWDGILRLRAEGQLPPMYDLPRTLKLQWAMQVDKIMKRNRKTDYAVEKVFGALRRDGYRALLLKGQGIARLYPFPESRMPGDIDVWLEGNRNQIIDYVRRERPICRPVYHHVDAVIDGVESVEVHFFPTWMYNYTTNRRLQQLFAEVANEQFAPVKSLRFGDENVAVPTTTFNSIYVLIHLYRHLFDEGIGLRQLLDYYYVLQNRSELDLSAFSYWVKRLYLTRFAGAVTYVIHQWFGAPIHELPIEPNQKLGEQLMKEILVSGNFGKFGLRQVLRHQSSRVMRAWIKLHRSMSFVRAYPSEVLAAPFFKLWHYLWRKCYGWI